MYLKVILTSFLITFKSMSKSSQGICNLLSDSIQVLFRFRSNAFFIYVIFSKFVKVSFGFHSHSLQIPLKLPSKCFQSPFTFLSDSFRFSIWRAHGQFPNGNSMQWSGELVVTSPLECFMNSFENLWTGLFG